MNQNVSSPYDHAHMSWINLLGGIWFIIAPFIWGAASQGVANGVIVGIIVAILAIIRMSSAHSGWASWINGILGLWMIIAPWAISYVTVASRWSNVIAGIIVAIVGFSSTSEGHTASHT